MIVIMKSCFLKRRYLGCYATLCVCVAPAIISLASNLSESGAWFSHGRHTIEETTIDKDKTAWTKEREAVLASSPVRQVLFLSYMRGGSKIGGEIFNQDPDTVMWHEPLAAYYMATYGLSFANLPQHTLYDRNLNEIAFSAEESDHMASYLVDLLSCQFDKLPPEAWMHKFLFFTKNEAIRNMRFCLQPKRQHTMVDQCKHLGSICGHTLESKHKQCPQLLGKIRDLLHRMTDKIINNNNVASKVYDEMNGPGENQSFMISHTQLNAIIKHELCVEKLRRTNLHCMEEGMRQCQTAELHVAKVNRMRMVDVETLIVRKPNLFIVHYVRDPRAIAVSRIERGLCLDPQNPDLIMETELICKHMRDDIHHRKIVESKYPNTTYVLRYEDLILDPAFTVIQIYSFIGKPLKDISQWQEFFNSLIYGEKDHLTLRKNGTESIDKWKKSLSLEDIVSVTNLCQDVIQELGYK